RGDERSDIINSYIKAHQFMPIRAEPLFRIAYQFYLLGDLSRAKQIASHGLTIKFPEYKDAFYAEPAVYQSWLAKLVADCCFDLGEEEESAAIYHRIAQNPSLSKEAQQEIQNNLILLRSKLFFSENKNNKKGVVAPRNIQF